MRIENLEQIGKQIHNIVHENGLHYAIVLSDGEQVITHVCDQVKNIVIHAVTDAINQNEQEKYN